MKNPESEILKPKDTRRLERGIKVTTRRSAVERGGPPPFSKSPVPFPIAKSARGLAQSKTWRLILAAFLGLSFAFCLSALGQYAIAWSTIDGGGGTSTGGVYTLSGTIGQPDAGTMSGGNYTLSSGFWSVIAAVQTPGAPHLTIGRSNDEVIVSWPKADPDWKLVFTSGLVSLGTNIWTLIPPPYPTNATDCVVTEPAPVGNKFYRLHKP